MSLLEVRCRLAYSSGFQLDVAFTSPAPVTALVGPSGSGKTSVLSVVAGLRRPSEGFIRLGPRVLLDTKAGVCLAPEARRVGYVFQRHLLFPHLSARANLLYGWKRRPADAKPIAPDQVFDVLELRPLLDRLPHTLSGGERQRVALGRALLCGPELLLLDEPLASVDSELRERVLGYIERVLAEWRIPTIFVTHQAAEIERLAGCRVELRQGKVVGVQENGKPVDATHVVE
jgi:molybdate transport system ATP-binding protein